MPESEFDRFLAITKRLRKECPWDRKQTHESIRHSLIEETYEVVEAIDRQDDTALRDELGDLMLHVAFHANIAEERECFTIDDVLRAISDKLIRRHPHVYGTARAGTPQDVVEAWEKVKMAEGRESLLDGIPVELPALLRGQRLTERASGVGFDWPNAAEAWKKVEEETRELQEAVAASEESSMEDEIGDLLFAVVNYSRFLKVNPELALRRTLNKFITRFRYIEQRLKDQGRDIHNSNLEEMDRYWNEAKSAAGSAPGSTSG